MHFNSKFIVITPGDPQGIGPEITIKAFQSDVVKSLINEGVKFICIGSMGPLWPELKKVGDPSVKFISAPDVLQNQKLFLPGFQAGWSVQEAVKLILKASSKDNVFALVTGPIHKERLNRGGFSYPGHTEFLSDLCNCPDVTMMLANSKLRVSLVTTHVALKDVSAAITPIKIERAVVQTAQFLRTSYNVSKPKLAVLALNPHGGEDGLLGREEIEVIHPTLNRLRAKMHESEISGPFPADTLYMKHLALEPYDAVIAMYHDQGLIPVKMLDFPHTVNITLGLPFIRTSVDHGVAFDHVGKNSADPTSLITAIETAACLMNK